MDRNTIDPDQLDLVEKWRRRHALPDVVALWAASEGSEAKAMAFNAIAQDPRVLQRAARGPAIKMAIQAEDYILSLESTARLRVLPGQPSLGSFSTRSPVGASRRRHTSSIATGSDRSSDPSRGSLPSSIHGTTHYGTSH